MCSKVFILFRETKTLRGIFLATCRFGGDVATLEKVQRRVARFVKGHYKRDFSVTPRMAEPHAQGVHLLTPDA